VEDLSDLRAMEEEVARSQRLAAMGEMAAGIAHEVRNPLGGIQLFVSLMAEEPDARARRGIMDQIQSAIGAVDQILANLLTFSRPLRPNRAPMDPAGLMEECVAFSLPLAQQKGVRLTLGPRSTDVPLEADRILLKQALLNILLNALQATPPGGAVRAWVQGTAPAFKPAQADTGPAPSCPWVELGVQDTGEGIPPDVIPRVTDPFYTTRPGGTGLGLTIVHNIVRSHGGVLGIRSEPGEGTRVEFRIPSTSGGPGEER
jgi:signal transduction histidine kinase